MKTRLSETPPRAARRLHTIGLAILVLGPAGCTTIPADLGRGDVDALVGERGFVVDTPASVEATQRLVAELSGEALSADSAVRIALLNNPALQAEYATLGLSAADVYVAGRIRNPTLSNTWLASDVAGRLDQGTYILTGSLSDLLTLPARRRLAVGHFDATKKSVGDAVMSTAAAAAVAYYDYVAARQWAALRQRIAMASDASAQLAGRFHDAGNIDKRELASGRSAAAEARLASLEADGNAFAARVRLATILGLPVGGGWTAPSQLPAPGDAGADLDVLLMQARDSRLDLAAARGRAQLMADQRGIVSWTRWLGEIDVGYESEHEPDGGRLRGPTLDLEIPVFDQHRDRLLRADADWQAALSEVRRLALAVEGEVCLAFSELDNATARIATYRDQLLPQHAEIVQRAQEQFNFMLIGAFELIDAREKQLHAYEGFLQAVRDYWVARTNLARAVGAVLPGGGMATRPIDLDELLRGDTGQHDRGGTDHLHHPAPLLPEASGHDKHHDHDGDSQ